MFIGNLDYTVTANMLLQLVNDKVGPNLVENIRVAIDKVTNKPKGFAHIDFTSNAMAKQAAQQLNEMVLVFMLLLLLLLSFLLLII